MINEKLIEIKETGGARIGIVNVTWPFATLKVTQETLELNAFIIGKLVFRPSDIISIEPHAGFFSSGLKINHRVSNYKNQVIFLTFGDVDLLMRRIEQTGILSNKKPTSTGPRED